MPTHRSHTELPIVLDRDARVSLPVQVAARLRAAIDVGALRPGEVVPSTRSLAARLGVARGVIVAAYEQLIAEGYLAAGQGLGTRVTPDLHLLRDPAAAAHAAGAVAGADAGAGRVSALRVAAGKTRESGEIGEIAAGFAPRPLAPGVPDTNGVDRPAWRTAWRHAMARAHVEAPALGDTRLRAEIAEHLRLMRGTTRTAADVIVTAGARDGLGLLLTALGTTNGRGLVVGVEDPGYPSLRRVAARHGAHIVALPVDADGLDPQALPAGLLDAIIVTPSHQYPLGGSLPLARRRELLAWAERTGAVIVEDDYDSELRHAGSPLPALAALDDPREGSVVLLGTFSKTVSQALAAGYLLAPERLRAMITPVRHDLGGQASSVVQAALAEYLASGELRRHTARMRRRYAARRNLVLQRLSGLPGVDIRPMSGGLHAVLDFGTGAGAREAELRVMRRSAPLQLGAVALSEYWQGSPGGAARSGLVIGTGGGDAQAFERALEMLRDVLLAELG